MRHVPATEYPVSLIQSLSSLVTGTVEIPLPSGKPARKPGPTRIPTEVARPAQAPRAVRTAAKTVTPSGHVVADIQEPSKPFVGGFIQIDGLDALPENTLVDPDLLGSLAEREIRRNLGRDDTLEVDARGSFVVRFATGDVDAAKDSARRIVSEIKTCIHRQDPEVLKVLDIDNFVQEVPEGADPGNAAELIKLLKVSAPTREQRDRAALLAALHRCKVTFQPYWNPTTCSLGHNRVSIDLTKDVKRRLDAVPEGEARAVARASVDVELIERALTSVRREGHGKHRSHLVIPVAYDTLAVREATHRLVSALAAAPEDTRPFLVLEITGMPPSAEAAAGLLRSGVIDMLRRTGATLSVSMSGLDFVHVYPLIHKISALSVAMGKESDPKGGERDLVRNGAYAQATGLQLLVSKAVTVAQAMAAIDAGCTWLSGPSVYPSSDSPKPRQAFNAVLFKALRRA